MCSVYTEDIQVLYLADAQAHKYWITLPNMQWQYPEGAFLWMVHCLVVGSSGIIISQCVQCSILLTPHPQHTAVHSKSEWNHYTDSTNNEQVFHQLGVVFCHCSLFLYVKHLVDGLWYSSSHEMTTCKFISSIKVCPKPFSGCLSQQLCKETVTQMWIFCYTWWPNMGNSI